MSPPPTSQPGIYGKLPCNGDFVTRRLPAAFVEPWDQWLQESIAHSQEQLTERWLDTYLTSPVWRFVLSSGSAGQSAWAGLLMPSVDRVGRYFPLTMACPLAPETNPLGIFIDAESWFDAAEHLLISCLERDLELEAFDREIAEIGAPLTTPQVHGLFEGMSSARRMPLPGGPSEVCGTLLHQTLWELFFAYSLWWSHGSELVEPSFLMCQGLPPSAGFAAMLADDWERWGWEQARMIAASGAPEKQKGS